MRYEITIDRFGRVVLPKKIREDLGLAAGSVIAVEERGQDIVLKPQSGEPGVVRKGGVLVHAGKATGDVGGAVRALREGRLRKLRKGAPG